MNLKQLEVFLAVAESGSFSRGADAALLTQSTVSQHISALEQEVGVKLLDRTGKGALLTEGGKVLLQRARRVSQEVREIQQAMNRFKGLEEGALTVGGSNIPGIYLLPVALGRLSAQFPRLEVTVLQGDSQAIIDRLARDEVEMGVVGSCFSEAAISFEPLGSEQICLVVPRQHAWQGRAVIGLDELTSQSLVARESGSGTDKTVRDALARAGVKGGALKIRVFLGSNEAVKQAVLNGVGAAFVSALSIQKELAEQSLCVVPVAGLAIQRSFYLANRCARELSPSAAAFATILRQLYGQGSPIGQPPG
jgi:LysR family transcriptional regulator, low CO2-responsive transcriptional regulator